MSDVELEQHFSIYVHFPWCIRKCYYCDFNSYALANNINSIELYLEKILQDFDCSSELFINSNKTELTSIFFGGGTPSILSSKNIAKILNHINKKFAFSSKLEISLEVNPATVEQDLIYNYKVAGINRISLGVQSFQEDKLKSLGRIHTVADIERTIKAIIAAKFDSFNLDLMYGLPKQDLADAKHDLQQALSFNPPHLSWYQLTIEPNTNFFYKPPPRPDDDLIGDMFEQGVAILATQNYINYEVSAFALDPWYCKHNLNYWSYGDYLGIGAGAHTKCSNFDNKDIPVVTRLVKVKTPKKYLSSVDVVESKQIVSKSQIIFEFMLNNLRLTSGFTLEDFRIKTGFSWLDISRPIQLAIDKNLLERKDNLIKPTDLGRRFLNDLQELFLEPL